MPYNKEEQEAIQSYCKKHDAKPQLSARPMVYFTMKDGSTNKVHISHLVGEFKRDVRADKKERDRAKREASRKAQSEDLTRRYNRDL